MRFVALVAALGATFLPEGRLSAMDSPPDFANNIQPLLQKNCVACHNLQKAEGGLNLESFEKLQAGGDSGATFEIGKAATSSLIRRVKGEEELMPPAGNNVGALPLTQQEIELLAQWIDTGAVAGTKKNSAGMHWQPIPSNVKPIYSLDSSSDGQFTVVGRANHSYVYRWAAEGPTSVFELIDPSVSQALATAGNSSFPPATHLDSVQSVAIDPKGNWIATGGYRDIKVWKRDSESVQNAMTVSLSGSPVLASSRDGRFLAKSTFAPAIEITSSESPKVILRWDAPRSILSAAWTPDGSKLVVQTDDNVAVVLPTKTPTTIQADSPTPLAIAPEMSLQLDAPYAELWLTEAFDLIGRSGDNTLHYWQWQTAQDGSSLWKRKDLPEQVQHGNHFAQRGDRFAIAKDNGQVEIFSISQWKVERSLTTSGELAQVTINNDASRLFATSKVGISQCWNIADGNKLWENQSDSITLSQTHESDVLLARFKAKMDRSASQIPELEKGAKAESENVEKLKKTRGELQESVLKKESELAAQVQLVTEGESTLNAAIAALEEAKKKVELSQKDLESRKQNKEKAEKAKSDEMQKLDNLDKSIATADQTAAKAAASLASFQSKLEAEKQEFTSLEKSNQDLKASAKPIGIRTALLTTDETALVTLRQDGALQLLKASNGIPMLYSAGKIPTTSDGTILFATSTDRVFARQPNGLVESWDVGNHWKLVRTIGTAEESPFSDRITALAFSRDGKQLVVGSGPPSRFGELKLLDVATGTVIKDWGQVHSDSILVAKLSPDGKSVATGGADKLIRLHSIDSDVPPRTLEGHTHHVLGLAWHDDGFLLASSSADNTVKIWDVDQGQAQRTIAGFGKEVTALAFLGRSMQLMSTSADQHLRIHNAADGAVIKDIGGAADALYTAAPITPDHNNPKSAIAIAGGQDGLLWIWQVDDGKVLQKIP